MYHKHKHQCHNDLIHILNPVGDANIFFRKKKQKKNQVTITEK